MIIEQVERMWKWPRPNLRNKDVWQFWGFRRGAAEDSIVLGYNAASLNNKLPTFRGMQCPHLQGSKFPRTSQALNFRTLCCFETSVLYYAVTQCYTHTHQMNEIFHIILWTNWVKPRLTWVKITGFRNWSRELISMKQGCNNSATMLNCINCIVLLSSS